MVGIDEKLEISDIQLLEEDEEIEIILTKNIDKKEIESCLDSESDLLDSTLKLVFTDKRSIKMLETTSSSTPVISSTETSNHYECSVCQKKTYRRKSAFLKHTELCTQKSKYPLIFLLLQVVFDPPCINTILFVFCFFLWVVVE